MIGTTTHFSEWFFTSILPVCTSKICSTRSIHLRYGMMLFIMCHFFDKAIVFIELGKTMLFFYPFFFANFSYEDFCIYEAFSLDLYIYNLNISRIRLIKTLLLLKMNSLLTDLKIPKMEVCGVKVGKIKLFWKHELFSSIFTNFFFYFLTVPCHKETNVFSL